MQVSMAIAAAQATTRRPTLRPNSQDDEAADKARKSLMAAPQIPHFGQGLPAL
jgi:hypothetical protein